MAPTETTSEGNSTNTPVFKTDKSGEQSFITFFNKLDSNTDVVRFFRRKGTTGGFYSVHGDDASMIAHDFYKSSSVVQYFGSGENKLAGVTLSDHMLETVVKELLLQRNKKVELWEPVSGKSGDFKLEKWGSAGHLQAFEDILFGGDEIMTDKAIVMAINLTRGEKGAFEVGVAYADATLRKLGIATFTDNDSMANIEAAVVQLGAKECVVPSSGAAGDYEAKKVGEILSKCGVIHTKVPRSDFRGSDVSLDLKTLLTEDSQMPDGFPASLPSLAALIKYLDLLSDPTGKGGYTISAVNLKDYMRLDAAAVHALNLLPSSHDVQKGMSVYGVLNHCKTPMGSRLLISWLKQPLLNREAISQRHDIVDALYDDAELRQALQDENLKRIPDLSRLGKKFARRKANLQDCIVLYKFVLRLPALLASLQRHDGEYKDLFQSRFAKPLEAARQDFENLLNMVEHTIDLEAAERHEYCIKADFDDTLKELQDRMEDLRSQIDDAQSEACVDLGIESIKCENNQQFGYFFRISRKDEKLLRNKTRYTQLDTRKDGVKFTNSTLRSISGELTSLQQEYQTHQKDLVSRAIDVVASYVPLIEEVSDKIAELDILVGFAHVAVNAPRPYVRPTLHEMGKGDIIMREARHPCVEVCLEDRDFIPNDIVLHRDSSWFQIITGPNMGGKSTYIRQAGVVILMAQIGAFVPCSEASFPVVDCILARLGAGDSQLRGVSTFMAEMLETAGIIKSASINSFVIIDELGRGTSTYDGFGLAWAISEHIAKEIQAPCLFATHFHELTALAHCVPQVTNRHVTAHTDEETHELTFLYQVQEGPCEKSFGIHVARLAHFPEDVIEVAKRKAAELEDFSTPTALVKRQKVEDAPDSGSQSVDGEEMKE